MNPIGDPCWFRAGWEGPPPDIGDYLRSERGRFAYCIIGVHPSTFAKYNFRFRVVRIKPDEVPVGAKIYTWSWAKRT